MAQDTRVKFIVTVILTAIFAYIVAPIPNKPKIPFLSEAKIQKGIDLAGGAELRYRVLFEPGYGGNKKDATQAATDVIRRRIEAKQLIKEPKITAQGDDQIIIQIAGVDQDTLRDYKRLIETAGKLELRAAAPKEIQEKYNRTKEKPQDYRVVVNPDPRREPDYEAYGRDLLVSEQTVIEGRHIVMADVRQEMVPGGSQWVTTFELDAEGAKRFDDAAARLHGQRPEGLIVIMLDNAVRSAPAVKSASFNGRGQISGAKNQEEARDLAIILRSGSLPAPVGSIEGGPGKPEAETFVGPTLGEDAIRRGMLASGLTLALVAIFMLVYYRTAGVIAVVTLILNLVFLLGVMAFFNATLTLPGIAGIVLTVGMAVDANILILERIREEQARGKSATQAFEAGHERAFSAIVDGNVTTLVAAVVLYYFGTGPIQGFAVTLSVGILTTLFSVLFCGKTFLKMLLHGGLAEFKMMKLMSAPKLDYLKTARTCVLVSTIMVVAGTIFFSVRLARGEGVGIDFKGGTIVSFSMNKPMQIQTVRDRIQSIKGPNGLPKFADAEVQTVSEPDPSKREDLARGTSRTFQMRTSYRELPNQPTLETDLQEAFKDTLSHIPFEEMTQEDVAKDKSLKDAMDNLRYMDGKEPGLGLWIWVKAEKFSIEDARKRIAANGKVHDLLERNAQGEPNFKLEEAAGAPEGLKKLRLLVTKTDAEKPELVRKIRDELKANVLADQRAPDPFLGKGSIGGSVAAELQNSTFWAMAISWALMIVYIAIRFSSWRYGVAAVIALVHDSLISIAFVALAGALVPASWGVSFDMNLTTMAAILTIIGYAINDKIVVFDRIRENLILMKKAPFAELINASVNQTMSRTILTGLMVWVASIILYVLTMSTGGGISEFAFPLIIGIIAGTYSTIYIAVPIVLWWYRGQRPAGT